MFRLFRLGPNFSVSALLWASLLLSIASASGCVSMYRTDTAQGNYMTKSQVDQLKAGMTKEQVRFIMGTPLLIDPFRPERWEYVFTFQVAGSNSMTLRNVSVQFDKDIVVKVEASNNLPTTDDGKDKALPVINHETLTK